MKVSIITCTLDAGRWLAQCIDSVLAQTHEDIEHVFVDGGSTDQTLSMIASHPWARLGRVRVVDRVVGLSQSMNAGAHAASGEVLCHLNADDYLAGPDAIATVVQAFERSGAAWLYGQCKSDHGGRITAVPAPRWSLHRLRARGNFIAHPAVFVRRELFERVGGFDTGFRCAMDYDLWVRLAEVAAPAVLQEFLAVFRYRDDSVSGADEALCTAEDECIRLRATEGHPLDRLVARLSLARLRCRQRRDGIAR